MKRLKALVIESTKIGSITSLLGLSDSKTKSPFTYSACSSINAFACRDKNTECGFPFLVSGIVQISSLICEKRILATSPLRHPVSINNLIAFAAGKEIVACRETPRPPAAKLPPLPRSSSIAFHSLRNSGTVNHLSLGEPALAPKSLGRNSLAGLASIRQ